MEPAAKRREHDQNGHEDMNHDPAAMEPAAERREHPPPTVPVTTLIVPQWSPPLSGGSTEETLANVNLAWGPQWSPPVNGGSTPPPDSIWPVVQVPQWSPPPSGGSTGRAVGARAHLPAAAMEPAAKRREYRRPARTSRRAPSCRNGARR